MRLKNYISESNIKPGDWVKGTGETLFGSIIVYGVFVSKTTNKLSLIATWIQNNKKKKKIYTQISNMQKSMTQSDAPKGLVDFAKKHSMFGVNK